MAKKLVATESSKWIEVSRKFISESITLHPAECKWHYDYMEGKIEIYEKLVDLTGKIKGVRQRTILTSPIYIDGHPEIKSLFGIAACALKELERLVIHTAKSELQTQPAPLFYRDAALESSDNGC